MPALFADEVSTDTLKSVEKDLGLSPNCLSSFGSIPGHEIINASVRFQGIVSVENHYQFRLLVSTGKVQCTLQKRYSHFREFRQQLLIIGIGDKHGRKCRNGACQQLMVRLTSMGFPRRKLCFLLNCIDGVRTARERMTQLKQFMDTILQVYQTAPKRQVRCCVNSQCLSLQAIRDFIDLNVDQMSAWKATSNGSDEILASLPPNSAISPTAALSLDFFNDLRG
ncbi:hypothetical protein PI124_g11030 [Phytophthora idaei]|nr:hypothetical protein PI125_g5210 [Phytophthora idaei]KAG3163001.1 hypothetical protein PI126_g5752 [Phytophthora idaei]KAG3244166.1 hypothetical protein PI124_g11030 [Phytophthora idaei]